MTVREENLMAWLAGAIVLVSVVGAKMVVVL